MVFEGGSSDSVSHKLVPGGANFHGSTSTDLRLPYSGQNRKMVPSYRVCLDSAKIASPSCHNDDVGDGTYLV